MTGSLRNAPLEVDELDVTQIPAGQSGRRLVRIMEDALGRSLCVPAMIHRGAHPGPVVGITAAVHGNELNGIQVIHRLLRRLQLDEMKGTIVGVPIVNVPAYMSRSRTLREGMDLNRLMPGSEQGNVGRQYAYRLLHRVIERMDYLIDLHTASFGRVNSLYVRANLEHPVANQMAHWLGPEILVHNHGADGTLRGSAMDAGIPAITVEVGDPQKFQRRLIKDSANGLENILVGLGLCPGELAEDEEEPVVCGQSEWIYAEHGGLLEVFPQVTDRVEAGELVARVISIFGDIVAEYPAPRAGIVVGKSTDPVCESGARIIHLGYERELETLDLAST